MRDKPPLIAVALADLKPPDMEVVRQMLVCPSCASEDKQGEYWILMCYRCYESLPPCLDRCVDREPAEVMLKAFLSWMKALSRTHVFLTRRGEEAADLLKAARTKRGPTTPAPPSAVWPELTRRPVQRKEGAPPIASWETIWSEEDHGGTK